MTAADHYIRPGTKTAPRELAKLAIKVTPPTYDWLYAHSRALGWSVSAILRNTIADLRTASEEVIELPAFPWRREG